jgi:hypothetical protein
VILQAKKQTATAMHAAIAVFPPADGRFKLQPSYPPVDYYRLIFDYIFCLHTDSPLRNPSALALLEMSRSRQYGDSERTSEQ